MFTTHKHIDAFDLEEKIKEEGLLPKELYPDNFISEILGLEEYVNDASYNLWIPDDGNYDHNTVFGIAIDYIKKHTSDKSIYIDVCW